MVTEQGIFIIDVSFIDTGFVINNMDHNVSFCNHAFYFQILSDVTNKSY